MATVVTSPQVEGTGTSLLTNSMTVAVGDYIALSIATNTNFATWNHVITKSSGTATIGTVVAQATQQTGGQHSHHTVPITGAGDLVLAISCVSGERCIVRPLIITAVDGADPYGLVAQGGSSTNSIDVGGTAEGPADSILVVGGTEWNDLGNPSSSDLSNLDVDNGGGSSMSYAAGWKTVSAGAVTGNLDAGGSGTADWDWVVVEYKATSGGAPAAGLTADPSELVAFFIRNQRQLHLWEGSPGAATVVVEGVADASFGGTFTAAGVPNTLGVAAATFGFTATALGVDRALGVAVATFGFTATAAGHIIERGVAVATFDGAFTAAGIDRALGVAAATFGGTFVASGVVGTPPVQGQATATFGGTFTTAGVPRTPGAATATYGGTFTASGVPRTQGVAAVSFGFTATAAGLPRHIGLAVASFGFTGTASGIPRTSGVAVATFGFTATASGFAGTPPVQGQAAATFGFTATVLGVDRALGVAVATYGFTATSTGHQHRTGTAVATFGYTATANSLTRVLGAASASFGFTAAVFIITYKLRLVAAGVNRYTATANASSTATAGTDRYSATTSNRYSGAAGGNRYSVEEG